MRRASISTLSLLTLATLACAQPAEDASVAQAGAANARATAQAAIEAQNARFTDALVKGDTAALLSLYAADAWVMPAGEPIARGHAEIRRMHSGMMSQMSVTSASLKSNDVILAGDYAIESGNYAMSMKPRRAPARAAAINDVGKYIVVWQKQADGSWKIVRDIWNADKAAQ